jgi:hypothetical protein
MPEEWRPLMGSESDEAKKIQAEFALRQLEHKERLLQAAKKSWFPSEYIWLILWIVAMYGMYWFTLSEWTSADSTLLFMLGGSVGWGTFGIHKRIDALIKLLELEGSLRLSEVSPKSGQA